MAKKAEAGFEYIPKRMRVAVITASDMYAWTAMRIYNDPFVVYSAQIKPTKYRVLLSGLKNLTRTYLSFYSQPKSTNPSIQGI